MSQPNQTNYPPIAGFEPSDYSEPFEPGEEPSQLWETDTDEPPPAQLGGQEVVRPGGVTAICVITIVISSLGLLLALVAFSLMGSAPQVTTQLPAYMVPLLWLSTAIVIVDLVVAVMMLSGSSVARIVFTVLVVLNIPADIVILASGAGDLGTVLNIPLSVVYLVVLYSQRSNDFFAAAKANGRN